MFKSSCYTTPPHNYADTSSMQLNSQARRAQLAEHEEIQIGFRDNILDKGVCVYSIYYIFNMYI